MRISDVDTAKVLAAIDASPETAGMGCVLIDDGIPRILRRPGSRHSQIVIELRRRDAPPRTPFSSPASEWVSAGLNCGGAVLAWVGVVGTVALAPETGGLSAMATASMYGGAIAASAQCAVSSARVGTAMSGNEGFNQRLDASSTYVWSMRGLDVVGLLSGAGAVKELQFTHAALKAKGFSELDAMAALNRHDRLVLTEALELQGARRVAQITINAVVKQRLLDGVGAALGVVGSSRERGGVLHDLVVWAVSTDR